MTSLSKPWVREKSSQKKPRHVMAGDNRLMSEGENVKLRHCQCTSFSW